MPSPTIEKAKDEAVFKKIGILYRPRDGKVYFIQEVDSIPLGLHQVLDVYMKEGEEGA